MDDETINNFYQVSIMFMLLATAINKLRVVCNQKTNCNDTDDDDQEWYQAMVGRELKYGPT